MSGDAWIGVALGLGLAAACGFRVFVPPLVLSIAARAGWVTLAPSFEWLESDAALVTLAVATVLEIGAYYIPWVDNLLDGIASPAAVVAGVVVTASVVTGVDPLLRWTLALIAGGGLAASFQALTAGLRGASSVTTAGLANPILSSGEAVGSLLLALLSILLPAAGLLAALLLLGLIWRRLRRRRSRAAAQ